jgi:NADH:ubiquinone oxidoreductase subunit H
LPRYRYDQLILLGWKSFLPLNLILFLFLILLNFNDKVFEKNFF